MSDLFDPTAFDTRVLNPTRPTFNTPEEYEQQRLAKEQEIEARYQNMRHAPLGPLPTWSFSSLSVFEQCPYRSKLSKIDRIPEPSGAAAERGSRIHLEIEEFIQGNSTDLSKDARKHFEHLIYEMRAEYEAGKVRIEEDWGFTKEWEPVADWEDPRLWTKAKLDVFYRTSPESASVKDWKTGRKFGNEIKHAQQLQLYIIAAFLRYPELEIVHGEMVYLDKGEKLEAVYTREEAMLFVDSWTRRGLKMTTATEFNPKPSFEACRWCPHGKIQDGADAPVCPFAYAE